MPGAAALENRLRFVTEIVEGIRDACGPDFIVGMTVSGAEPYPSGLTMADKQEIFAWLDERGLADYFSCGTGSYHQSLHGNRAGLPSRDATGHAGCRRHQEGRDARPGHGRSAGQDARAGGGRHRARALRSRIHRARADCRSAPRQQGTRRPRGRHSPVYILQSALYRAAHAGLPHLLPRQSLRRPRTCVGRR